MLKSKYPHDIDNSLLEEWFEQTLWMVSDPKIQFFLEKFQPCKVKISHIAWKTFLNLKNWKIFPSDDFEFDGIENLNPLEGEELYILPVFPESLTRKILFPSNRETSKLRGRLVRKIGDDYETIYEPKNGFFFHSSHFIAPEYYAELIDWVRKDAFIPYSVKQWIADQVCGVL